MLTCAEFDKELLALPIAYPTFAKFRVGKLETLAVEGGYVMGNSQQVLRLRREQVYQLSTRTHQREEDKRNGASPVRNRRKPSPDAVLELRDSACFM
jgi:hypothetical protein